MLPVSTLLSLLVIICSRRASAQLQPTTPGPNETYTAGSNCTIAWAPDSSGSWTNVTIDLMSGSNNNMSLVTNVALGLDGTDVSLTPFSWTCPEVDPYSTIYFYQFTNGDDISTRAWTTRFTIASPANMTELPENLEQPDGSSVPWGLGHVISGTKLASASDTSTGTTSTNSSDVTPSNSATERSSESKKPHKHKSDPSISMDTGSNSDPEDGDDDDQEDKEERIFGKDHPAGDDESEEDDDAASESSPSTRTHPGATSTAARVSSVAHSGPDASPSSPTGSDTNGDGESDDQDDPDDGSRSRSGSGSRSQHESNPDTDWSSSVGSQAQAQSPFSPHDSDSHAIGGTGDDDCRCGAVTNGGVSGANSQMDASLSGIVSSVAPGLIVALVVSAFVDVL